MTLGLAAAIVFDFLVFIVWPGYYLYTRFLLSPRSKRLRSLRFIESQIDQRLRWDGDLSGPKKLEELQALQSEALTMQDQLSDEDGINEYLDRAVAAVKTTLPKGEMQHLKEWVDIIIVVFGVVAGARVLFLQPFKIPTGSMQPTLYGVWFEDSAEAQKTAQEAGPLRKALDYVNFSKRYTNAVVEAPGRIDAFVQHNHPTQNKGFFPYTKITIGDHEYRIPGTENSGAKYISHLRNTFQQGHFFEAGDVLARGSLELGDHLFVDRVTYNFFEPRRGDVVVFITDGIKHPYGGPLSGRYYIKRLVGLPGDHLRIIDSHLEVRPGGTDNWQIVDSKFDPVFDRIYTSKDYHGHYTLRSLGTELESGHLRYDGDVMEIPLGQYFMLGDNTRSSQDSRYWSTVPRENIVGKACFIYWPFYNRWGFVDGNWGR